MPKATPPTANDAAPTPVWRFFRASADGREVFRKELEKLPRDARASLVALMRRYVTGEMRGGGDIKPVRDGIYELRWRQGNNHYRVLFFRWGPHPVALKAFYKNQQQTPQSDIDRALDRRKTWKAAFGARPLA